MKNTINQVENINLIRKIAWSFHTTTGIDIEELTSEAILAYYSAIPKYNPEKNTKLITYAYYAIRSALVDFCKNEYLNKHNDLEGLDIAYEKSDFDIPTLFPEGVSKSLVDAVIDMANSYGVLKRNNGKSVVTDCLINFQLPPKKIRGQIINELRSRGWSWSEIWRGIREVKLILKQN
jgi:RNA polymerase sigma factor (sigma-70 family)